MTIQKPKTEVISLVRQPDQRIRMIVQPNDLVPPVFDEVFDVNSIAELFAGASVRGDTDETLEEAVELLTRK